MIYRPFSKLRDPGPQVQAFKASDCRSMMSTMTRVEIHLSGVVKVRFKSPQGGALIRELTG